LHSNANGSVSEAVIDGPDHASRPDQSVVPDFDSTGRIQLRIRTDPDVAPQYEPIWKIDDHSPENTASGTGMVSIERVSELASDLSRNGAKDRSVPFEALLAERPREGADHDTWCRPCPYTLRIGSPDDILDAPTACRVPAIHSRHLEQVVVVAKTRARDQGCELQRRATDDRFREKR